MHRHKKVTTGRTRAQTRIRPFGGRALFALTAAAQAPSGAKLDELMDKSSVSDQIATVSKNLLAPGRFDDKLSTAQRTAVHTAKERDFPPRSFAPGTASRLRSV